MKSLFQLLKCGGTKGGQLNSGERQLRIYLLQEFQLGDCFDKPGQFVLLINVQFLAQTQICFANRIR